MPTVLTIGAFRFYFYANENNEPAHIHVQQGRSLAKFWLEPIVCAKSTGFSATELNKLAKLVTEHQSTFERAWNEFFNA
jgi:Domain of unknown function (DUF4160)